MKPLLIIASGPSICRIDFDLFSDWDMMIINRPWLIDLPPIKYCHFNDHNITDKYGEDIKEYDGIVLTNVGLPVQCKNLEQYDFLPTDGFAEVGNKYFIPRTSTWSGMQIAHWKGYDRIVVVGIDQASDKGVFYADGHKPLVHNREERFWYEARSFTYLPESLGDNFLFVSDLNPWPWFQQAKWHCTPASLGEMLPRFKDRI